MTFGTRGKGVTTRSNPMVEYLPLDAVSIAKGAVCVMDAGGHLNQATSASAAGSPFFVTVEAVDNSGGSAGDLAVGAVGSGQHVTVEVASDSAALTPGDAVKVSDTDAGEVELFVAGTDAEGIKVGVFLRKEGGTIAKNGSTPFTEEYTDGGDYSVSSAAAGDIIEVRLN
jgi:hypothetical protein